MNSPKPRNWPDLTETARTAAPPAEIDVRFAVRQQIESKPHPMRQPLGLMDELATLLQVGWLRGALAALLVTSIFACWHGLDAAREIAWFYELQGPALASLTNP